MDNFYDWKPGDIAFFASMLSASLGFVIYWFIVVSNRVKDYCFNHYSGEKAWVVYVVFQKVTGVLWMGVIPGIILLSVSNYTLPMLGIALGNYRESAVFILLLGSLITTINFFHSKKVSNQGLFPQMRIANWTKKYIAINTVAWAAYLFAYEFMFRGLLLFVCYYSFGFWPAVAINLALYSATHIPQGLTQTIGAFPFGFILCYVTISTGSIAFAFAAHLVLALTNDYFSVYHNPEMKFV